MTSRARPENATQQGVRRTAAATASSRATSGAVVTDGSRTSGPNPIGAPTATSSAVMFGGESSVALPAFTAVLASEDNST